MVHLLCQVSVMRCEFDEKCCSYIAMHVPFAIRWWPEIPIIIAIASVPVIMGMVCYDVYKKLKPPPNILEEKTDSPKWCLIKLCGS